MEALIESILDSSRRLVPDLPAASRRRSTTYIPVGESAQDENAISILLKNQRLASLILAAHPCAVCLLQAGTESHSIRDSL